MQPVPLSPALAQHRRSMRASGFRRRSGEMQDPPALSRMLAATRAFRALPFATDRIQIRGLNRRVAGVR